MDAKKEIVKLIQNMSGRVSPYNIFSDWIEISALAIQNACYLVHNSLWQKREDQYKAVINKYTAEEQNKLVDMFNLLWIAFEEKASDILGEIYMESGCGNKNTGQFFTPYHLSLATAELVIPDDYDGSYKLSFNEPSTGGGGMMIAASQVLKSRGFNYQKCMKVVCQDLDWKGVYMTYIQLSILGVDAIVVQGDTLCDPYREGYPAERVFRTPKNMGVIF